jgi:hypothetical protein
VNSSRNTVVRSMHDVGAAGWFGGSLMGAVALNGASKDVSLDDSGASRGWLLTVLCRVFRPWCLAGGFPAGGGAPDVLGGGTGSDRAGAGSFPGRRDGVAGQAGSGRAHSRCQQVRKASFQGQVRLIFSTRARAWRTSRAGSAHSR